MSQQNRYRRVTKGKAGRKLSYPDEVDENLAQWLLCMRERHLAVSMQMLRDKALTLIKPHSSSFQASEGWARKFMKRHSFVFRARTSVSQKLPSDLEAKIADFHNEVKEVRLEHEFAREMIGNMDETPMMFDMVPGRTIATKGVKQVRVRSTGAEKRHVTVVLGCTAAGKMLPPMIIFKGK